MQEKNQLVSLDRSNNTDAIDVTMDGSVLVLFSLTLSLLLKQAPTKLEP